MCLSGPSCAPETGHGSFLPKTHIIISSSIDVLFLPNLPRDRVPSRTHTNDNTLHPHITANVKSSGLIIIDTSCYTNFAPNATEESKEGPPRKAPDVRIRWPLISNHALDAWKPKEKKMQIVTGLTPWDLRPTLPLYRRR